MGHAFISYSRKDSAFVDRLEAALAQRGIIIWRDQHNIPGGEAWYQSIVSGLDSAYAMICVLSPNADESRWVLREQLYGDERRIPRLPVLVQPHRVPFHMLETQPISCIGDAFTVGVMQLVSYLQPLQAKVGAAPAGSAPAAPALDEARLRTEYLRFLLAETKADLRDSLYVSLSASAEQAAPAPQAKSGLALGLDMEMLFDLKQLGLEQVRHEDFSQRGEEVTDARQPIREYQRVVLLGEPGAGKTTTLLKLVVDYARQAQTDAESLLPVFVPLREYNGEQPFASFVQQKLGILQAHTAGLRVVYLFDALNEMPRRSADGRDLVAEVRDFLRDKSDWVLSCRVRDYQDELAAIGKLGKVRIKPLEPPQIQDFIQRFYQNTPGLNEHPERAERLWAEMKGSPALLAAWEVLLQAGKAEAFWGLAYPDGIGYSWEEKGRAWRDMRSDTRRMMALCRNPYMLTMVCRLYGVGGQLPPNRGALFQQFVAILLKREEASAQQVGAQWLDSALIRRGLAQVAYALGAETEMPRSAAKAILRQHLPDVDDELLLRCAASASMVEVGSELRFTHQLLQEYFASEVLGALVDEQSDPRLIWLPERWWQPNGREETAIILAGVRGDPEGIARWIAPAQPELAYQVLTDAGVPLDMEVLQTSTRQALITSAKAKLLDVAIDPRGRAAAGRVLGKLNADDRKGVGLIPPGKPGAGLPDIEWCDIPAPEGGKFWMGADTESDNPRREVELKYSFKASKYLITYAQFQAFVDDREGFYEARWWEGLSIPDGHREAPGDQAFKFWNHPRERVSWYDAVAFTRWLTARYRAVGLLAAGEEIRLPTEFEWEYAARGTDGRAYPYGGTFDASKGNTDETGIGQTSAVGIFLDGASPFGLLDMSGNVWEWCLTDYSNPQLRAEDENISSGASRVLRGGSWFINQGSARAAARSGSNPGNRSSNNGFRVFAVCPPSL